MKKENESFIFTSEDIFQEIPGDPDNVLMKFPPEVLKLTGWTEGDVLDVKVVDGKIVVTKNG